MVLLTARTRAGDLIGAERLFLEGEEYFKVAGFRRKPGAIAQTYGNAARVASLLGAAHTAEQRASFALHVAAANGNPYDLAFASHMAAANAIILRRMARARDLAAKSVSLSDEHDYPQFAAIARIALGRATAGLEDPVAGIALMREGLEAMAHTGARAALTMYLTWLAEALELGGMSSEAVEALDQALTANPEEKLYNAEALRLRGALLVQRGDFDRGEADVREALRLATAAAALRFKIRAAGSLAAIVAGRGRRAEAVDLLAGISAEAGLGPRDEDMKDALRRLAELRARGSTGSAARPDASRADSRKPLRAAAGRRSGRRPVTPRPAAGHAARSSTSPQPPRS
jgi:tetratricopeptide (TPR) repeat protein